MALILRLIVAALCICASLILLRMGFLGAFRGIFRMRVGELDGALARVFGVAFIGFGIAAAYLGVRLFFHLGGLPPP